MRSRAARTVWRSGAPGCTCACARPAGTSAAATARRTATRRLTPAQRNTRSFGRPSQERLGAGATSTRSRSSSRRLMLPKLHLADWRATKDTLHLYCQIVGKIRMVTVPPRNHWWHVTLYVDTRGLTTRRMHHRGTTFEIAFDFVDHALVVATADGRTESFALRDGLSVSDFDRRLHGTLADLGIDLEIREEPFGVPMTTPFREDSEHASWDRDAVERFGRILDWSNAVLD